MEDDKLLEELRAQRELIRKHLEWIERKIAEREDTEATASEDTPAPSSIAEEPSEETQVEDSGSSDEETSDDEADKALQTYRPASGNDVTRAKIGCLVLFVLSIALFLFLLFGLPYLL